MFSKENKLLEYLSRLYLEFGILDGEGNLKVNVNILNTDNTVTVQEMEVADVMYFTEYGTITIPGKYILEKSLLVVRTIIDQYLERIVDSIFDETATEGSIRVTMNELALRIRDYVRNYMISYIKKSNTLGQIIHEGSDENKYLFDLDKLSKYIRCIVKLEN